MKWVVRLIMVVVVLFALNFILQNAYKQKLDYGCLRADVLTYRLMYGKNLMMYTDDVTGRVYTGIIDLEEFRKKNLLDDAMGGGITTIAIEALLKYKDESGEDKTESLYFNKDFYETVKSSTTRRNQHLFFVKVKDGDRFYDGILDITVFDFSR